MELAARLDQFPRLPLGAYPTPLEPLPRLSAEFNRPVWIKRDDQLGPAMGGNKTRKLEYLLAEACRRGAKKVVTFGGLQSNHARLTAASAIRAGLEPHLFYFDPRPPALTGNLLLNRLLGARMHFLPLGSTAGSMTIEQTIRLVRLVAWAFVGPHYFIPVGGHHWLGCLGYVQAALELDAQARLAGIEQAWLVTAAGSGGTLAGLLAGLALANSPLRLVGIDVGKLWKAFPASIAHLAAEICARLGEPRTFSAGQVPLVENVYAGQAYAVPSPAGQVALEKLARLEGVLADPVYTAKALAGLLDLAAGRSLPSAAGERQARPGEPMIFLHTGGVPAIFA